MRAPECSALYYFLPGQFCRGRNRFGRHDDALLVRARAVRFQIPVIGQMVGHFMDALRVVDRLIGRNREMDRTVEHHRGGAAILRCLFRRQGRRVRRNHDVGSLLLQQSLGLFKREQRGGILIDFGHDRFLQWKGPRSSRGPRGD
jgi:hypothetical protein